MYLNDDVIPCMVDRNEPFARKKGRHHIGNPEENHIDIVSRSRTFTCFSKWQQPLPLVLLEQPLVPLLTEDLCFFAGPHKSSGYSSNINIEAWLWWDSASTCTATAHSTSSCDGNPNAITHRVIA